MAENTLPRYRPDVDGLRALAVVSIILYHLRAMPLPGAFVTLDIFFVISGYLIGAHVARDVEAGRFSLRDFYLRRVRRILPALAAMLAVTAAACAWLLYPEALARFGASLAAASVAGANIFFWSDSDYFAPPAQTAPLLHTWSLGVEEQYYFVFPALMLLLYRVLGARRVPVGVAAIALVSLAVATWGAFTDPTTAFYWPHTRMWEFLAGTAILYLPTGPLDRRWLREATVAAGLALVAGSVLLLRTTMPFPGITALPAVLGTAMVIAGGSHADPMGASLGTRLLSIPPARWIGLISYSLYLWHWPLILIYKAVKPAQYLSGTDKAGLFLATFAVGYLSWRWIEEPFRRSRRRPAIVFGSALIASALLAAAGLLLWRSDGFPQRIDPAELALVRYERSRVHPRAPGCHLDVRDPPQAFVAQDCLTPDSQTLLLGDSHANHLWQALQARSATPVSQATAAGCRPTLDNLRSRDPDCRAVAAAAFAFLQGGHPARVLLAARWSERDLPALARTLAWLEAHGQHPVVVGPIAEYDASLPILLALARHRVDPGLPARHLVGSTASLDARFAAFARAHRVGYLSPYRATCPVFGVCITTTPAGAPIQHDYGHFTIEGADYVVGRMLARPR